METYKNIDEFLVKNFPIELQKIGKQKRSKIQAAIEDANAEFDKKLKKILEDENQ